MEELGHPYTWVQTLGGLHFPRDASEVCVEMKYDPSCAQFLHVTSRIMPVYALFLQAVRVGSSLSASQMESTMKLLRGRVQSRLALHKQFASLGTFSC